MAVCVSSGCTVAAPINSTHCRHWPVRDRPGPPQRVCTTDKISVLGRSRRLFCNMLIQVCSWLGCVLRECGQAVHRGDNNFGALQSEKRHCRLWATMSAVEMTACQLPWSHNMPNEANGGALQLMYSWLHTLIRRDGYDQFLRSA
jgi:hypothetical protein